MIPTDYFFELPILHYLVSLVFMSSYGLLYNDIGFCIAISGSKAAVPTGDASLSPT